MLRGRIVSSKLPVRFGFLPEKEVDDKSGGDEDEASDSEHGTEDNFSRRRRS
jgi:hypothetical protein